jgi:PAS domain S-box-containing protein
MMRHTCRSIYKTLTVLFIEDEDDIRELGSEFLSRQVGILVIAKNGAEGLETWRQHNPDIIITNIRMPVMDGLAMLKEIRSVDSKVTVIILSAFEESDYLKRSIDLGVSGYFVKPIVGHKFQEALLACAGRLLLEKQLEQSRKETARANDVLNSIIENMTDWVWETAEGHITYCSPQVERFLGYTAAEIIGTTPLDLMPPEDVVRIGALFGEISQRKESFRDMEHWCIHKNGYRVLLTANGVPIAPVSGLDDPATQLFEEVYQAIEADLAKMAEERNCLVEDYKIPDNPLFVMTALYLEDEGGVRVLGVAE